MTKRLTIEYLANRADFLPVIAAWVFGEWGEMYRMVSVEEQIERLAERLNKNRLPLALVAVVDAEPVGTASLKIREMTTHPHLEHWLGSVYVPAEHRNRGIGSALVQQAEALALELGVSELYLHTPAKEGFYARRGWHTIERPVYYGMPVALMEKKLGL